MITILHWVIRVDFQEQFVPWNPHAPFFVSREVERNYSLLSLEYTKIAIGMRDAQEARNFSRDLLRPVIAGLGTVTVLEESSPAGLLFKPDLSLGAPRLVRDASPGRKIEDRIRGQSHGPCRVHRFAQEFHWAAGKEKGLGPLAASPCLIWCA